MILTAIVNGLILLPFILLLSPSAFVADISGADLLITDDRADASVLSNLDGDGLALEVVRLKGK